MGVFACRDTTAAHLTDPSAEREEEVDREKVARNLGEPAVVPRACRRALGRTL